ncbi:MAG: FHA domain-containing protein, partial [Okeania sp. SIO2D1]|nr:FHA domain-containing protein [Okeania sp. SIO2D1]
MVTLTLLNPEDQSSLKKWQFSDQHLIKIGRAHDNHIVFNNCLEVSRYHLELQRQDNSSWKLLSKGTNGTFLNGISISEGLLTNEALIQLAKNGPLLKFQTSVALCSTKGVNPRCPLPNRPCQDLSKQQRTLFCIYCGQPLVEKEEFIRQYQILRTLGQGGMG